MLLSALALAAALQAAPEITLKGHLPDERPFSRGLPVGELTATPRKARAPLAPSWQPSPRFASSRRIVKRWPLPKKDFVVNPQTVNCRSTSPELVSNSDTLLAVPLSKMPKARGERAVARMVDGCPVPVLIAQGSTF